MIIRLSLQLTVHSPPCHVHALAIDLSHAICGDIMVVSEVWVFKTMHQFPTPRGICCFHTSCVVNTPANLILPGVGAVQSWVENMRTLPPPLIFWPASAKALDLVTPWYLPPFCIVGGGVYRHYVYKYKGCAQGSYPGESSCLVPVAIASPGHIASVLLL